MSTLNNIIEALGGLHDSRVIRLVWLPEGKSLEFQIEDFYSNFEGLPEYKGPLSGSLVFRGIEHIEFNLDTEEKHLNIYEVIISASPVRGLMAKVTFRPSGNIILHFNDAIYPKELSVT